MISRVVERLKDLWLTCPWDRDIYAAHYNNYEDGTLLFPNKKFTSLWFISLMSCRPWWELHYCFNMWAVTNQTLLLDSYNVIHLNTSVDQCCERAATLRHKTNLVVCDCYLLTHLSLPWHSGHVSFPRLLRKNTCRKLPNDSIGKNSYVNI
jgi:hypothetical protein